MKDTEYAFCVARIRAKETELLSNEFIEKLIECQSYFDAVRMLQDKGWMDAQDTVKEAVRRQSTELWQFLSDSVPDKNELDSLCVLNDYFNIKTAVKSALTDIDASDYYIYPTTIDLSNLCDNIKLRNYDSINIEHKECASEAYELGIKTDNGQNVDIFVDRLALNMLFKNSENARNKIFTEVCAFFVDSSNIKTALRCCKSDKSRDFVESAISLCKYLDRNKLIDLACDNIDELYNYLLSGKYSEGVSIYKENPSLFDKWCDNTVINIIKDAKYTSFGFGPVCAYYYAKLTEIKSIRILLSGKLSGINKEIIRERVRNLYV